jgi:hypothetical protein
MKMKKYIYILILMFISCNNKKVNDIQKPAWDLSISSDYNSDNDLIPGDINNLDKINGFRLAKFNTDINHYSFDYENTLSNDKTFPKYGFDFRLYPELLENDFIYFELYFNKEEKKKYELAHGNIVKSSFKFYNKKLKLIELCYEEKKAADSRFSTIELFNLYRMAFGNPTCIMVRTGTEKRYEKKYKILEEQIIKYVNNMDYILSVLDHKVNMENKEFKDFIESKYNEEYNYEEMDVKFIWETDKVYFEILFLDKSKDWEYIGDGKYIETNLSSLITDEFISYEGSIFRNPKYLPTVNKAIISGLYTRRLYITTYLKDVNYNMDELYKKEEDFLMKAQNLDVLKQGLKINEINKKKLKEL